MPAIVNERIDLDEIIRFVLSLYEGTSEIRYEIHSAIADAHIWADRSQLIRLFTNLLNNAVQAIGNTPEGTIQIQLSQEQQKIIITVSDNGKGIPPAQAEKIFQPEFTTKTGGMGLGLAIVKGIVEGVKGEITFTSKEQKGTTFIIKIPVNDEPANDK